MDPGLRVLSAGKCPHVSLQLPPPPSSAQTVPGADPLDCITGLHARWLLARFEGGTRRLSEGRSRGGGALIPLFPVVFGAGPFSQPLCIVLSLYLSVFLSPSPSLSLSLSPVTPPTTPQAWEMVSEISKWEFPLWLSSNKPD